MCGIYFNSAFVSNKLLNKTLENVKYRGPDNKDILRVANCTLAHLRLSIIDLDSRSNQPMSKNNISIVFNGEIYNFLEIKDELLSLGCEFLTQSDTEVIIEAYRYWGISCLKKFNGMFAFVILDLSLNKVFVCRDRLGVKPIFYNLDNNNLQVASLSSMIISNKNINKESIQLYTSFGYIPTPYTVYDNIFKLESGNYLEWDLKNKVYSNKSYWSLKKDDNLKKDINNDDLKKLLIDCVKIRQISDVKIGSFLSSGVDSVFVSLLSKKLNNSFGSAFTIGFKEKKLDETPKASILADKIGVDHFSRSLDKDDLLISLENFIKAFDEPFSDSAALPSILLSKLYKKKMTVALSGDGGDELFYGYKHYKWANILNYVYKIPFFIRIFFSNIIKFFNQFYKGRFLYYLSGMLSHPNKNELAISFFSAFQPLNQIQKKYFFSSLNSELKNKINLIDKVAFVNNYMWLESNNNVKVDRSSMYSSIEVRSPLLDYRLFDLWKNGCFQYDNGKKSLLKKIILDFSNQGVLNELSSEKKGFTVPISSWLRNELKQDLTNCIKKKYFDELGISDQYNFVNQIYQEHISFKADWGELLWRYYVLVKWFVFNEK